MPISVPLTNQKLMRYQAVQQEINDSGSRLYRGECAIFF